jgi:hypothetical protein
MNDVPTVMESAPEGVGIGTAARAGTMQIKHHVNGLMALQLAETRFCLAVERAICRVGTHN